jgi:hypothetical protein
MRRRDLIGVSLVFRRPSIHERIAVISVISAIQRAAGGDRREKEAPLAVPKY